MDAQGGAVRLSERGLSASHCSSAEETAATSDSSSRVRISVEEVPQHRFTERVSREKAGRVKARELALLAEKAEKKTVVFGLRHRLLIEAAERALRSETPWSDLSVVALAFKKMGDDESARYWFARAVRLAKDPDDQLKGAEAMREVVKSLLSARYLDLAEELVARIPDAKMKDRATSDVIRTLAGSKQFDQARILARVISDAAALGLAYRNIAEAEARHLGLDEAMMTVRLISDSGTRDQAMSRIAAIRAGMGDSEGALSLVDQMSSEQARDVALVRLAKLQGAGGKLSIDSLSALIHDPAFRDQALREMVASEVDRRRLKTAELAAHRIKNSTQRAKAYESLVMLLIRHREIDAALARAQSIGLVDFRNRALQSVAVAQVSARGVKAARNIANFIGDADFREVTYRKIASRASVVGQSRLAVETIRYMGDPSERAMAFASVALTRANHGDDRSARRLAQDADRELEEVSSLKDFAKTAGLLAEVYAQTGDANAALDAAASISNSGLRDLTYQKMTLHFARSKETDFAEQSAQLIVRDLTRERALDSIAITLAGGVSVADAMEVVGDLHSNRQQVRFLIAVAGRT